MVLYPMFVHMYLELVYKGSEKEGKNQLSKGYFFVLLEKASGAETVLTPTNRTSPKRKKSYHRILFHDVFKRQNGNIPNPNAQRWFPPKHISELKIRQR